MDRLEPGNMLRNLIYPKSYRPGRASSYQTDGRNHDYWVIPAGGESTIADLTGPGCISHIWMTVGSQDGFWPRRLVVRAYWDSEPSPSVEVPFGDFFGCGHGIIREWESLPMSMSGPEGRDRSAFNCWLPMPFARSARLTVANEGANPCNLYFYVDYEQHARPLEEALYFHAMWRRENPCRGWADSDISMGDADLNNRPNLSDDGNYLILEAEGRGSYIGCNLSVHNVNGGWWGEGDDMIFVDGEGWPPSLHGTGSEDYFSHAYGMQDVRGLFNGTSVFQRDHESWRGKWTVYRWHVLDPVPFTRSIRVSIEHGHANCRSDDYASTAYWYQTEPHRPFEMLLPVEQRLPNPEPGG